jgi:hypothetical protein
MVILERSIARIIRYRRIFFPKYDQLNQLTEGLAPFDLVRVFYCPDSESRVRPIAHGSGQSLFVDLSARQEEIYSGLHPSCRYKVRRAEKMQQRIEIAMNTEPARADFLVLFNDFVRAKREIPVLTQQRLEEYFSCADIFVLYFDGRATCGRLLLRDAESSTALMLYSATRRLDDGADTITIGLLNRYLHWHEMKTYQDAGIEKYDFGGASASRSVLEFKRSFGARSRTYNYCVYAGSPRMAWGLAHALYARWTRQNLDFDQASEQLRPSHSEDVGREQLIEHGAA